jgi:hypothetical protein
MWDCTAAEHDTNKPALTWGKVQVQPQTQITTALGTSHVLVLHAVLDEALALVSSPMHNKYHSAADNITITL